MKVLEPWAGIRLASGHPLFHLAQFIASWIALSVTKGEPDAPFLVVRAFNCLQWGHFACFMLHFVSNFARRKNALCEDDNEQEETIASELDPSTVLKGDPKATELDTFKARTQASRGEDARKVFSRVLDTISVFLYQGTVFNAQ